jgi:hypothetical protein
MWNLMPICAFVLQVARRLEASARISSANAGPPNLASSSPATDRTDRRTYLSKIKLQHHHAQSVGSCVQELTAKKTLAQRIAELEKCMSAMHAANQNLLSQLQVEMTARHVAEDECVQLREQLN